MKIEVLSSDGCAHLAPTMALLEEAVAALAPGSSLERVRVATLEEARRLQFLGSPSIRVDGLDLQNRAPEGEATLACRQYDDGPVPPRWLIEAALLRAARPRHILFLCVANSARSQLAEGLARALAPAGVTVSSAGSAPTQVRPQAIAVLAEQGIDISHHRSKPVASVDAKSVEAVVTLCGEEACPLFLGRALRVHWGLPDPAGVEGTDEEQLQAFRHVRDEIRRRLEALFSGWGS